MDSIFRGDLGSAAGRRNAWIDALLVDHAVFRLLWTNFAEVLPGRLYRGNHPTPGNLARFARRHGIRSVVNLRGNCGNGADALSRAAARRLGLEVLDVAIKSSRAPSREEVLALLAALDAAPEPMLVHCKSGADRAGFAAGVFLLSRGGTTADALGQLSLRFGHLRRSRTGILGAFFQRYRAEAEGRIGFREWVRAAYDPAALGRGFVPGRLAGALGDHVLRRE